jgi:ferredoxin
MERTLKLVIHADRCQGHNRCKELLPELIALDELGNAHAVGNGAVPERLAGAARLAQANCPEFAVVVVEI